MLVELEARWWKGRNIVGGGTASGRMFSVKKKVVEFVNIYKRGNVGVSVGDAKSWGLLKPMLE